MTVHEYTGQMNRMYRRQRYVYDATRKYFLLGRDRLIEGLEARDGDKVLEIGCGTGRNLLLAAHRYPGARFYGIDVSTEMLTSAIRQIERAGQSGRIRVAHADATAFDPGPLFAVVRFDHIFISYTLSMIPLWQQALGEAISRLSPDGALHIVDFGGQSGLPRWARTGLRRWTELFDVMPRDRLESHLKMLANGAGADLHFERPYRDYAQYARLRLRS